MDIASAFQTISSKLANWWRDREDERLDDLAAGDYRAIDRAATDSGITAYQLVTRARNSRNES